MSIDPNAASTRKRKEGDKIDRIVDALFSISPVVMEGVDRRLLFRPHPSKIGGGGLGPHVPAGRDVGSGDPPATQAILPPLRGIQEVQNNNSEHMMIATSMRGAPYPTTKNVPPKITTRPKVRGRRSSAKSHVWRKRRTRAVDQVSRIASTRMSPLRRTALPGCYSNECRLFGAPRMSLFGTPPLLPGCNSTTNFSSRMSINANPLGVDPSATVNKYLTPNVLVHPQRARRWL